MLGKTHKYVGACCGIIATEQIIQAPITPEKIILGGMLISGSMIGALLLDIDHTGSTMGKKHPFISKITNFLFGHRGVTHAPLIWISLTLLLFYLNIIMPNLIRLLLVGCFCCFTIYRFLKFVLKKLNISKSKNIIISAILSIGGAYYLSTLENDFLKTTFTFIILGIFIGAISHIFLDSFNPSGTPWLLPFSKKRFKFAKLSEKTGIIFDIIFTVLVCISTYFLIM